MSNDNVKVAITCADGKVETVESHMSLAKEFWNQKHAFIENQLKYKQ